MNLDNSSKWPAQRWKVVLSQDDDTTNTYGADRLVLGDRLKLGEVLVSPSFPVALEHLLCLLVVGQAICGNIFEIGFRESFHS